jgi:DNA replication initiation complex subunit (GINS family)
MLNTNFSMMQHHKYSLTELDNMIPWERQIYVSMLHKFIEEENERIKKQNNQG